MKDFRADAESRPDPVCPKGPPSKRSLDDPGLLTWGDLVRFIRRRAWIILSTSAALSASVVLVLAFLHPPRYEAVATLVIAPERLRSERLAPVLSVEGYQRLLESNAVLAETRRRLDKEGLPKDGTALRLGVEIDSDILAPSRANDRTQVPMVEVVARAHSPADAAAVANTWSRVFLEQARQVQEDTILPIIGAIEEEYRQARQRLMNLMETESRSAGEYQARLEAHSGSWDRKLADSNARTQDLVLEYQAETRREMERLASEAGLDGAEPVQASSPALDDQLLELLSLRTRLALSPGSPAVPELTLQIAALEDDLELPSSEARSRVLGLVEGLERLQVERADGLAVLVSERAHLAADLERQRARESRALEREQTVELARLDADIRHQRALLRELEERTAEAGLVETELALDEVRLATPATAPEEPLPRDIALMAWVSAFVGGLLGLVISLALEVSPVPPRVGKGEAPGGAGPRSQI